jgi:hypothetical protein
MIIISVAMKNLQFTAKLLLPVAFIIALTSCSAPPPAPWNAKTAYAPAVLDGGSGFNGEVVTDAITTTAKVVSVDHAKRIVVLKRADGTTVTYKATPNAPGFADIQAGDFVKVSVAEELAVGMGKKNLPPGAGINTAKLHVRLPDGTQAVAAEVGTIVFNAQITAIDDWLDTVTLQLPDGTTKKIRVSEYVNLADVSVGDNVSVQSTEAAVLVLEKL